MIEYKKAKKEMVQEAYRLWDEYDMNTLRGDYDKPDLIHMAGLNAGLDPIEAVHFAAAFTRTLPLELIAKQPFFTEDEDMFNFYKEIAPKWAAGISLEELLA